MFLTKSDTKWAVQSQKMVRGLKFWIEEVEGHYEYVVKTKALISCTVTAQLICAYVFAYAKKQLFSWRGSFVCKFDMFEI